MPEPANPSAPQPDPAILTPTERAELSDIQTLRTFAQLREERLVASVRARIAEEKLAAITAPLER